MADLPTPGTGGKSKLPPLSPTSTTGEGSKPKKKVVKKKKKPAEDGESKIEGETPKAAPRRKKTTASTSESGEVAPPKKKKKVVKKTTTDQEGDPTSARSGVSQGEDVSGSKASLIKDGTPRKKKVKKKVKKTVQKGDSARDDLFDSTLAADLTDLQDDIITEDSKKEGRDTDDEEEDYKRPQYAATGSAALRSQPTEKFYIETGTGFKGENKNKFVKRQKEEEAEKAITIVEPKHTTLEFAIKTHKVLRTFFLFCHGMLAGFAGWHIVMSYILRDFGNEDFLGHYQALALPVQCVFYILLAACTVSACDRFDVAEPKRRFIVKALTLQNGTISVVIYFAALVISLANAALEDKINLYEHKPELWNVTTSSTEDDLDTWSGLNTSRNALCILGWFIISITPETDRLTSNLRETDEDDLLGVDIQTVKMA